MTLSIYIATTYRNEDSNMTLKKEVLIIINKVKSEQCFAVTSPKRVAVFQQV